MAALEERIERLSWSISRGWLGTQSLSCNCQKRRSRGNRRYCRAFPEDSPVHSPEHSPPLWGPGAWEDKGAELPFLEFNLGLPTELGPDVDCFLQELANSMREGSRSDSSPELPAEEYRRWVTWQGQVLNMPDWWQELVEIPEIDDHWELAQWIRALFKLPQRMSELHDMGNYYLAPPVPPCLCWKDFLLLPNPKFPCWDIREEQLEKTVVYVQALQFWAEKSNPPTPGQPHLLAGSILELREVMEPYISFPNDVILDGVAPLEGFLKNQPEKTVPESDLLASPNCPIEEATAEETAPVRASGGTEYSPDTM